MPDEQLGLGPAALENPENEAPVQPESPVESSPAAPEAEPAAESPAKYEKLLSSVKQVANATGVSDEEAHADVANIKEIEGEQEKVDMLVKLAQTKGLPHAVKVAERLKDYYALDKFHDALVDNLYDSLLQQGLITKE